MATRLRFFKLVLASAHDDRAVIVYVIADNFQKPELFGSAARNRHHIYAESTLQIGILEK